MTAFPELCNNGVNLGLFVEKVVHRPHKSAQEGDWAIKVLAS